MANKRKTIPDDVTAADQVAPSSSARPTVTPKSKPALDPLLTSTPTVLTAPVIPKRHILINAAPSDDEESEVSDRPSDPLALPGPELPVQDSNDIENVPVVKTKTISADVSDPKPADRQHSQKSELESSLTPHSIDTKQPKRTGTEESQRTVSDDAEPETRTGSDAERSDIPVKVSADAKKSENISNENECQQKVAQLIASETYFVPINAVARRRSRVVTAFLLLLALILLLALADLLLDVGIIRYDIPHTRFFSSLY